MQVPQAEGAVAEWGGNAKRAMRGWLRAVLYGYRAAEWAVHVERAMRVWLRAAVYRTWQPQALVLLCLDAGAAAVVSGMACAAASLACGAAAAAAAGTGDVPPAGSAAAEEGLSAKMAAATPGAVALKSGLACEAAETEAFSARASKREVVLPCASADATGAAGTDVGAGAAGCDCACCGGRVWSGEGEVAHAALSPS
eukprot:scaffold68870_cov15-Tisochrysis_lutea.AAC.1